MRRYLFPADELPPGGFRIVEVDSVSVVVVRGADGRFRALRNRCAHQGGPLSAGTRPLIEGSDVGKFEFSPDREVLRCSWHYFEYDIDTGRCPADPQRLRVRAYPAGVEDGQVYVDR